MKTLEEYMEIPYRMEIEEDPYEGGYVVSFPDLPGCLTCAETWDEALEMAQDAKREWLNAAIEDHYEIPVPKELQDYSGQFKLRVPRSLHRQLALHAKRENMSMNQYCVFLLSKNDALMSRN